MSPLKDVTNLRRQALGNSTTDLTKMQSRVPLTLDKVPTEIQRKIYINLLKADHVRQPPDEYLVRSYHFHTAILSANKRIYQIAHPILYQENHFIVVSCSWEVVCETMTNHEVATVSAKRDLVARFKKHVMRLHVAFSWAYHKGEHGNKSKSAVLKSFIILQDDLHKFIRLLHILGLSNGGTTSAYNLTLRIEEPTTGAPDERVQKLLLEPFRQLTCLSQNVKIFGCVDTEYTQNLLSDMMFQIRWTRAVAWQLYAIMVSIIKVAEEALQLGNTDMAFAKYEDCQRVWQCACGNNPRLESIEDEGFHTSRATLTNLCHINIILLGLQDPSVYDAENAKLLLKQTDILNDMNGPIVTPLGKSKMYHYRGIANAFLGRDDAALQSFRKAIRLDTQNQILRRHIVTIKKRIAATSLAGKLTAGTITADGLQFTEVPDPSTRRPEYIAGERYLLRKFNYKGDMLPQIEEKKPADIKEMEKMFKNLEVQKNSVPAGEPWCAWVGSEDRNVQTFRRVGVDFSRLAGLFQSAFAFPG